MSGLESVMPPRPTIVEPDRRPRGLGPGLDTFPIECLTRK